MSSAIRPGMTCEAVDASARRVIESAGLGDYFIHRLGHGIGLDIHEPPFLVQGNATPLEAGMCMTVEPGVYVPGRFGIRIEDVVVVTPEGSDLLSSDVISPVRLGVAVVDGHKHRLLAIGFVLIVDLADDLLEHVLDRDQAGGAAIFVNDHRHVDSVFLEVGQQLAYGLRFRNDDGLAEKRIELEVVCVFAEIRHEVPDVEDDDFDTIVGLQCLADLGHVAQLGEKEAENEEVNINTRGGESVGNLSVGAFIEGCRREIESKGGVD